MPVAAARPLYPEMDKAEHDFRTVFKSFKASSLLKPIQELCHVSDLCKLIPGGAQLPAEFCTADLHEVGLIDDVSQWRVYESMSKPGLQFICNCFTLQGQYQWALQCLRRYSRPPHKTNVEQLQHIPSYDGDIFAQPSLVQKLRWITMGYHHNWDTKVYDDTDRSEMPADLFKLCRILTSALNVVDFRPEASIVNFYHLNSTLGPHVDRSEDNLSMPIVSFSLGCPAVFLIGTEDPVVSPDALLVSSGDVVMMGGESRSAYHAVPRIMKQPNPFGSLAAGALPDVADDDPVIRYLATNRVNVNVRQRF